MHSGDTTSLTTGLTSSSGNDANTSGTDDTSVLVDCHFHVLLAFPVLISDCVYECVVFFFPSSIIVIIIIIIIARRNCLARSKATDMMIVIDRGDVGMRLQAAFRGEVRRFALYDCRVPSCSCLHFVAR